MKLLPTLDLEKIFRREGVEYIAGVDEAGRGPVAGPVSAAAVIFPVNEAEHLLGSLIGRVRDSKQIREEERESIAAAIKEKALAFSVSHVPNETIDSINILNATRLAVRGAINSLKIKPQVVLIDGKFLNLRNFTCVSIVKGDANIFSIAAASIIAKTSRDALMHEYGREFPNYFFEKNKGYLTSEHLSAIRDYGFTRLHRKSFAISL